MSQTDRAHVADAMIIEWDVPIEMDDGLQLRAQIFRPVRPGFHPVLLSHGPFAKGASFQTGYEAAWSRKDSAVAPGDIVLAARGHERRWPARVGSHLQMRGDPARVVSCGRRRSEFSEGGVDSRMLAPPTEGRLRLASQQLDWSRGRVET